MTTTTSVMSVSDTELIKTALKGNQDSYEQLYNRHKQRVKSSLMLLSRTNDVEDLIQETFLQAFKHLRKFRFRSAFSTWLHRIAVNVFLMDNRGNARHHKDDMIAIEGFNTDDGEAPRFLSTEDLNLKGCLDRITISKAISGLPAGCKGIFIAHHVMGLSHKEIAKLFDTNINNSKSKVHRAAVRVRQVIEPKFKVRSKNGMGNK